MEHSSLKHAPLPDKPDSRCQDCIKHYGLQLLHILIGHPFAWKSPKEHSKVATYQSRSMAALNSLLHLVPMSGAVALLVLFWSRKWTDGSSDNATTLQFVAKLHEMLMQASLVTILLYIIQNQALNGYIPLGAISGAAKAPQLSYLWSLDFASAIASPNYGMRRKILFALSTLVLLSLTAVVGPSSAVLMIPRPGMPYEQVKQTRYTNVSDIDIFPSHLDYSHGLNFSMIKTLEMSQPIEISMEGESQIIGSFTWPDDKEATRIAKVSLMGVVSAMTEYVQAIATIPTVLSGSQLIRQLKNIPKNSFGTRVDIVANSTLAVLTLQPGILATCTRFSSTENEHVYYVLHDGTSRILATAADMHERMYKRNESILDVSEWAAPLWMTSPEDPASLIGVFLRIGLKGNRTGSLFSTCTVTPFWRRAKTWIKSVLDVKVETDLFESKDLSRQNGFRPITIATGGMAAINSATWLSKLKSSSTQDINPDILVRLFASAISEVPGSIPSFAGEVQPCCRMDLMEGYSPSQEIEGTRRKLFESIATSYGYGYGADDTSIRLSVAVITTYCIITLLYVTYIITTGHTSVAWDSPTELIMLALQSQEPKDLGSVSVGLDSPETFRRGVGIRVSTVNDDAAGVTREKLELVFEDDKETNRRGLTKVVRGVAY